MSDLVSIARQYSAAGLLVVPCVPVQKRPTVAWKELKTPYTPDEIPKLFTTNSIGIVTGSRSGGLEVIDFDQRGLQFNPWLEFMHVDAPGLVDRLVIEKTPSGGFHTYYRCEILEGNQKLANRAIPVSGPGEHEYNGKKYPARTAPDGGHQIIVNDIETRGEGGFIVCAPTPGYEIVNGDLTAIPIITADERETILSCARRLNEFYEPAPKPVYQTPAECKGTRPGDMFNAEGDAVEILKSAGWTQFGGGENLMFTRPGKTHGVSGTYHLKYRNFHCFTSNGYPFDTDKDYSPFAVLTHLRFNGDFSAAAKDLASKGWGVPTLSIQPSTTQTEEPQSKPRAMSWGETLKYSTENDPNCLLGHRWLSKGGSCVWVGSTGMGKSSLLAQACALWALQRPFFGIVPHRPLRSLIIQAENDEGDISEITKGVTKGLCLGQNVPDLSYRVFFGDKSSVTGDKFIEYARSLIHEYKPDLLWIDPLFAYCGCDVSNQKDMSNFLRGGLQKIAEDTGVCNMVIHHTNKIKAADKFSLQPTPGEDAYSGSGTAEISNWARAVMRVKRRNNGEFELIAAKRGKRTGLIDANGQPAESVYLKHAQFPDIYWLAADEPVDAKAIAEREAADDIVNAMTIGQMYSKAELKALSAKILGKTISYIGVPDRPAYRSWKMVEERTKDFNLMGFYKRKI